MPETVVVSRSGGAPYSKGLMAQSLSAIGLPLERAYELARQVEGRLDAAASERIDAAELATLAEEVLRAEEGEAAVRRFRHWRRLDRLDRPLVILLAGTAGVGKSTLATMLAHRLGLTRVIATDVIRQVLRAFLSREFMPVVHYSSFEAGAAVSEPTADPDVAGFEHQAASVGTGVDAIVERACGEGTPLIVEGIHVVPGALGAGLRRRCLAVEALLVVGDEDRHRAHFTLRGGERPAARYLARFAQIRKLQDHLTAQARAAGVPVVDNATIDSALSEVMDLVLSRVGRVSSSAAE